MNYAQFYNSRNGTIFGIPTTWILGLILVAVYFYFKKISEISNYFFGENKEEKEQREKVKKEAEKAVNNAVVSYGAPTSVDKAHADQLFQAMDSYTGDDSKVYEIFGKVIGKYAVNRVYSAFGVKTIHYGWSSLLGGAGKGTTTDLIGHLAASKINLDKKYRSSDGVEYTLRQKLSFINKPK